jgi:hypothetical protein
VLVLLFASLASTISSMLLLAVLLLLAFLLLRVFLKLLVFLLNADPGVPILAGDFTYWILG